MIRVGSEGIERTLALPHVRPMKLGGRRLAAFVFVDPAGCRTDSALERWVQRGTDFVSSPPSTNSIKRTSRSSSRAWRAEIPRRKKGQRAKQADIEPSR